MGRRGKTRTREQRDSPFIQLQWESVPATLPTARPWSTVAALIPFPSSLAGQTIIDVGAGGSDAVAALLAGGANAFAVDPRYRSLPALVRDVDAYFAAHEAIGQMPQAHEASARPIARQRAAFQRFAASFQDRRNEARYRAAVATQLPFSTSSADLVYSLDCITQYLDREYELLAAAILEALRVLRPGGRLVLVPFRDDVFALGYHAERQQNQERLLQWLEQTGLRGAVEDLSPTGLTGSSRLVIVAR